jgi:hypothetical protein
MSMDEREEQDEALIEQLRTALGAETAPASVTEFAKAALTWRRIDAELAELLSDSALDAEPALARGAAVVRSVSFSAGETIVELEIHPDGERRTLLGQLSPAAQRPIVVQHADGGESASAVTDELGRFRITLEQGGTVRLRITDGEADSAVETAWIPI